MKIMTGKTGTPHVTSQQFRQLVEGTVGQDSYILKSGENLEPELQTNNLLKIRSGMMTHHGNVSIVDIGTYDEVTIQNGTQGMKRIDLVVNRYTQDEETGIEKNEWVEIMGTPAASNPQVPEYTVGNLQDGDLVDDCPVLEVHLDGINVTKVVKLLDVVPNITELNGKTYDKTEGILGLASRTYILKRYRDGTFELNGRADASKIHMQYSESSKKYFASLAVPLPAELDIADDRYVFTGGTESGGLYDVTLVSISGRTMTIYLSANNYTGEIPIVKIGFELTGHWK